MPVPGKKFGRENRHQWIVCGEHDVRHLAHARCPICEYGEDPPSDKVRDMQPVVRTGVAVNGGEVL